jgi:hypothetical protein
LNNKTTSKQGELDHKMEYQQQQITKGITSLKLLLTKKKKVVFRGGESFFIVQTSSMQPPP